MKFNEAIKVFSEELIRPDKEVAYQVSDDYKYVWVVVMKDDHFLIEVDGPPISEPEDKFSKLKSAAKYTKQTAINLLKSVRDRLIMGLTKEELENQVIERLMIPFEKYDYKDIVESKEYAKEIIQGSRDLYDHKGIISLDNADIEEYIV
jgi:hypothetical protein